MSVSGSPRAARKTAVVCSLLAAVVTAVLGLAFSARASSASSMRIVHVPSTLTAIDPSVRAKYGSSPLTIASDAGDLLAYPPRVAGPAKPITVVYLHGIHGRAENGCPWLREGASEVGWLVCPSANTKLPNGTYSWGGTVFDQRAVVANAERAAARAGADASRANVLVGFSQGSFVAVDLVDNGLGRYRGLVLVAAEVEPSAGKLRDAGVTRVALAAGELDGSFGHLSRTAARLRAEGVDVRFVSLGKIGHTYQTTEKDALARAIAWAGGADGAPGDGV